ncbi:MAG: SpoIID/LytB domain-containing protein [Lachnospiraceae bacterium]
MIAKIKKFCCAMVIIILLPYVVTIFANGVNIKEARSGNDNSIRIQTDAGIIEMDLEEYAIGILAKELPDEYEDEAAKAQAVIVRNVIYKKIQDEGDNAVFEEQFWTTKEMQKNWGASSYAARYQEVVKIWEATADQVITYNGQIVMAPFHQLSNGKTRDGKEALGGDEYAYLVSKECPKDLEAENQMQTTDLTMMECEVTAYDSAGYVLSVTCGTETISGEDFRQTYNLQSGCFTVQEVDGKLRVTTQGVGHGLGLSQNTANEMAKEGNDYLTILEYFFDSVEIKEVSEIL